RGPVPVRGAGLAAPAFFLGDCHVLTRSGAWGATYNLSRGVARAVGYYQPFAVLSRHRRPALGGAATRPGGARRGTSRRGRQPHPRLVDRPGRLGARARGGALLPRQR